MRETAQDLIEAGWAALAQRRWEDARGLFERAGSSAQALDGLGWAAWWRDDADATFAARESAYRAYRAGGDPAGAARMAVWLAGDHADFRGELAVASGWLQRAARLLDGIAPCAEHGWLAFYEAYFAFASGDAGAARGLAARAAELGRSLGVPDLEMLGLGLEGSALVTLTEIGEGMRCLDEAAGTALAGDAAFPISIGWTCCFLISACESVGDLGRAWEWCDRVAEFSARHGSAYLHGICRTHYAAMSLWRGDWTRAEEELLAAVEDFERSRPPYVGGALAWLAELRRRQGRGEEARQLIARAAGHSRAALCQAHMALDRGDALEAAELAERLLRRWPVEHRMDRADACALLVRARCERDELDAARAALKELLETAALVGTPVLHGTARLAEGLVAAGAREHERARPLLEDAVDLFDGCPAPFEAAQARGALAVSLAALGRPDAAAREARAASEGLRALGAVARAVHAVPARAGLTRRETEVLRLVAEGLTNAQIAQRLVVSRHTVHRHVTNVLRKLDLPSRAAAAAHAARHGLLD